MSIRMEYNDLYSLLDRARVAGGQERATAEATLVASLKAEIQALTNRLGPEAQRQTFPEIYAERKRVAAGIRSFFIANRDVADNLLRHLCMGDVK